MMELYEGLEVVPQPQISRGPTPSMYQGMETVAAQPYQPRVATGALEHLQAGYQGSAVGLAWRGRLPDLFMDPEHSKWWERALSGGAQVVSELPLMIPGAIAGGAAGGALGTAVAPGPGTAVGTILGTGAGMFAAPGAVRETLLQAYKSGEISTAAEFWVALQEVAKTTAKEAAIGAVTFGTGSVAARTVGRALVPAIGTQITIPTATKAITAADVAGQIAGMVGMPAAIQGRLPDWQEFMDAAIVIGGLKTAHVAAERIANVYARTGKTPVEQVAEARTAPEVAREITAPPEIVGPQLPPEPLRTQETLFREVARLDVLEAKPAPTPADTAELDALRLRIVELEKQAIDRPPTSTEEGLRQIFEDVRRQMTEAGRPEDEAAAIAALERARYRTRAERLQVDPWELYSEGRPGGPRIAGPAEPAPTAPSMAKEARGTVPEIPAGATPSDVSVALSAYADSLQLRGAAKKWAEKLPGLPRGVYEALEKIPPDELGAKAEGQLQELRRRISTEGQTAEVAMRAVWGPELADAPPGLRQTIERGLALQKAPPEPTREKKPLRALTDPDIRALLQHMGESEAGWETIGGRLDIARYVAAGGTLDEFGRPTKLGTVAFTEWIPRAEWWRDRPGPGKLNEKETRAAVRKALAGEKLNKREARTFDYLLEVANARMEAEVELGRERWDIVSKELIDENVDPTTRNVLAADLVAKAAEHNPDAVERAAIQFESDDAAFIAEIRRILSEPRAEAAGRGEAGEPGPTLYQRGELQRFLSWRDGVKFERELFGGSLDASLAETGTAEQRAIIRTARERYNLARRVFGLEPVTDWTAAPADRISELPQPPRFEQQQTLLSLGNVAWQDATKPQSVREQVEHYLGRELAAVTPLKVMDAAVLPTLQHDKVREAVIEAIPVNVVDILSKNGFTPEQLLREPDMVSEALTVNDRTTVAGGLTHALEFVGTRLRTALDRILSVEPAGRDGELLPAVRASDLNANEVVGLLSPTTLYKTSASGLAIEELATVSGAKTADTTGDVTGIGRELSATKLALFLNRHAEIVARDTGNAVTRFEPEGQPLFQPGQRTGGTERGSFTPSDNLIRLLKTADRSTALHEIGHSWLEEMRADAGRPDAPGQIKTDWDTLRRELAIPATGDIPVVSHEQWAKSVERYVAEGKAPSVELEGVFARFRQWLLDIYHTLIDIGAEISPDMRDVLDRMLATDQEIATAREMNIPRTYAPEARANEARKIIPGFKAEQISMQPYADELPTGPGWAPDNTHVNYKYINTPQDVKLTMQRMAEIDQVAIQQQRGGVEGVKSWEQANAEQAKYVNEILGGGPDTLRLLSPRDPGTGPDVKLGVLKKLAVGAAKESARLRDVILEKGPDASVREQLEYMGSIERARMIQAEFLGERAGVARALNALKDVTEGSGEIARMLEVIGTGARTLFQAAKTEAEKVSEMKAKLDEIMLNYKGKTVYDIAKLHKEIGTLKGTYKFAKEMTRATKWEMVVEGWKASLLSGPVTHTTNFFGTGAYQGLRPAVDLLAAGIGMVRGAKVGMGPEDRASMSEALARLTGWLGGVEDGLKVGYHTFMEGETTGKTESFRQAIPGRAGELARIPLRLMSAEDAVVTTMYERGALRTLAIRQAFEERIDPRTREFAERVSYLLEHPTPEMAETAQAEATRMTFNAPLGEKGRILQLFVNRWNLQWMVPFIRTPINIAKELARLSPFAPVVGEWRAAIAKGGVERDRALAELALGTGIMALAAGWAFEGNLSGSNAPDPGKVRGKVGVWQPGSILIGDTWYEIQRIQPMGTLLVMAADMANVWDHMNDEEKDKVPKMLALAFSNAVTNQTFLQGITNVVNAMSDPTRFFPRWSQQMAGSVVPNIVAQPTAMADPTVREVNSMLDAIKARVPGLREQLLPKRDWLGQPIPTKERLGVVLPIREQKISEDKVRLEAARLDISMAAAPKKLHIGKGTGKLGDVELTPEETDKFEQAGGKMAHQILTQIVNAPNWDGTPDMIKRRVFNNAMTAAHKYAAAVALPPDKRMAYIQGITEKMAVELQAPNRE